MTAHSSLINDLENNKKPRMKTIAIAVVALLFTACNNTGSEKKPGAGAHDHQALRSTTMREGAPDYADSVNKGYIEKDTLNGSPLRMAMANIGRSHIHIEYGSPGVKGRVIWGGLVSYGTVWVTGAHEATSIDFSKDVLIAGKPVKAGMYALFTIPGKDKWVVILNTNFSQHLADEYNQQEDVARFDIVPLVTGKTIQRLTYTVERQSDTSGTINMEWENIKITLPVIGNSRLKQRL
jgi:hypothetical protein